MKSVLSLLVLAVILGGVAAVLLKRLGYIGPKNVAWPFFPKKLLTQPEQVLYHRLVAALPDHMVLAQVQLSRVLGVKKGFNFHEWNNRINRLSLDFVVCRKDASIVAAIELDDKTHERPARIKADARKSQALSAAGVRLLRWRVSAIPDDVAIRGAIVQEPGAAGVDDSAAAAATPPRWPG